MDAIGIPGQTVEPDEVAEAANAPVSLVEDVLEALVEVSRPDQPWHDADVLERLFHEEGMTDEEIAEELGCGEHTVNKWRRRHGIMGHRGGGEPKALSSGD